MNNSYFRRTEYVEKPRKDNKNLRDMLPYIWDYRGRVLLALLVLILAKVANVGIPVVLKYIVDALDTVDDIAPVLPVALLAVYGVLRLSSALFNELRDAIFARVRYRAMRQLSNKVIKHLHNLSLRFHLERQTGAISRDLERGTRSVSSILNYMIFNIIPTIVEFGLIGLLFFSQYDIKFAIDYETVKAFGNEQLESRRYDETLDKWEEAAVKSQTSMSLLNFGQSSIIAIGVTIITVFASQGVVDGSMSLGDLVLINTLLLQLFIPLNFLGVIYRSIKYALTDMDLIFRLLERQPEITDDPNATILNNDKATVRFENVHFHYQAERLILKNVDFDIPDGHKVAVVGTSGAGKSTLARLLFRFYDVTDGSIKINGQDIRYVTQKSLRETIGIVPQDTVLFNETIYYNLAYARPDADKAEIYHAAQLAHIHEFITSLPKGYDTVVGERGLKLSGGEKQRVAIARAILKRPKILIFDEATSSLDSKSEQAIQNALAEIALHHTTLVIAHRLSTIVDADKILVMEQGEIVESGTHASLLAKNGIYAHMWQLQQEEKENTD